MSFYYLIFAQNKLLDYDFNKCFVYFAEIWKFEENGLPKGRKD